MYQNKFHPQRWKKALTNQSKPWKFRGICFTGFDFSGPTVNFSKKFWGAADCCSTAATEICLARSKASGSWAETSIAACMHTACAVKREWLLHGHVLKMHCEASGLKCDFPRAPTEWFWESCCDARVKLPRCVWFLENSHVSRDTGSYKVARGKPYPADLIHSPYFYQQNEALLKV